MKTLLIALAVLTIAYVVVWGRYLIRTWPSARGRDDGDLNLPAQIGVGFLANFLDTLGIGSFATTSSIYKLLNGIPDDLIPGTMNVGHTLPTATEAFIFVAVIPVDFRTLVSMIVAAAAGAWLGGWNGERLAQAQASNRFRDSVVLCRPADAFGAIEVAPGGRRRPGPGGPEALACRPG